MNRCKYCHKIVWPWQPRYSSRGVTTPSKSTRLYDHTACKPRFSHLCGGCKYYIPWHPLGEACANAGPNGWFISVTDEAPQPHCIHRREEAGQR